MLSRFITTLALLVGLLTAPTGWSQKPASSAAAYLLLTKADEAINSLDYNYGEIVEQLQRAIKEDPTLLNARLHLAYVYLDQSYMTPEEKMPARNEFLRKTLTEWVAAHPAGTDAVWNMVWFQVDCERSFDEAWKSAQKLAGMAPHSVQANRAIAYVAAVRAASPIYDAMQASGLDLSALQPIPDAALRHKLHAQLAQIINEGMKAADDLTTKPPVRPLASGPPPPSARDREFGWGLRSALLRFQLELSDAEQSEKLHAQFDVAVKRFSELFDANKEAPPTPRTPLKPDEPAPGIEGPPAFPPPPPPPPPPA